MFLFSCQNCTHDSPFCVGPGLSSTLTAVNVFPQACYKEVISLEPEVKEVSDAGNDLIQKEGLHGDPKEDIVKDIRDIEDRYEHLKKSSDEEVKR